MPQAAFRPLFAPQTQVRMPLSVAWWPLRPPAQTLCATAPCGTTCSTWRWCCLTAGCFTLQASAATSGEHRLPADRGPPALEAQASERSEIPVTQAKVEGVAVLPVPGQFGLFLDGRPGPTPHLAGAWGTVLGFQLSLVARNPSSHGRALTCLVCHPGPGRAQLATTSQGSLWALRGHWDSSQLPPCACTLPLRPWWPPPVHFPVSRRPWTPLFTSSRLQCPWPALVSWGLDSLGGLPGRGPL